MTSSLARGALPRLPALVYEVCWERLQLGVMPFPLVVFQHGRDGGERAAFREQATRWLVEQGLGDATRIGDELAEALRTMADFEVELTTLYSGHSGQYRIGCFAKEGRVLRVVLHRNTLELVWVHRAGMPASVLEVLPPYGPGEPPELRVPADPLAEAGQAWALTGRISDGVHRLTQAGADPGQAERFLDLYASADAIGQASALRPDEVTGHRRVAAAPLTFLDTTTGRYAVLREQGWLVLRPAGPDDMLDQLAGLLTGEFH